MKKVYLLQVHSNDPDDNSSTNIGIYSTLEVAEFVISAMELPPRVDPEVACYYESVITEIKIDALVDILRSGVKPFRFHQRYGGGLDEGYIPWDSFLLNDSCEHHREWGHVIVWAKNLEEATTKAQALWDSKVSSD